MTAAGAITDGGCPGQTGSVETIGLLEGDVRWVFPGLKAPDEVLDVLKRADEQMLQLAGHLRVRPSWTGSGIEFHLLERGHASLWGCVEAGGVSFVAELWCPRPWSFDSSVGPPWEVEADISVRCDRPVDCGMHAIEEQQPREYDTPVDAARRLLEVTRWLRERGTSEPLTSWLQRETEC